MTLRGKTERFVEGFLNTFCLKGVNSRRNYFAGLAFKYASEGEKALQGIGNTPLTHGQKQLLKADYRLAVRCERAAKGKLTEDYQRKIALLENVVLSFVR